MYKIRRTSQYKKSLKREIKRKRDISLLDAIVDKLAAGLSLEEKHNDHALHGDYEGFRECHILPDWLLIYCYFNDVLVLVLQDTGTHSDLFR